jgi:hypothetical protein
MTFALLNTGVCRTELPLMSHWWEISLLRQRFLNTVLINNTESNTTHIRDK